MSSNEKETDILAAICEYLEYRNHFFWRANTAGIYRDGRYFSLPKYARRGVPDIILVRGGYFYGLEVKTNKGRSSVHQESFKEDCEKAGGKYYVVRSIEDVQALGL